VSATPSHRYGAPMPRYALEARTEIVRSEGTDIILGAPPLDVSTGLPGSREKAMAYVDRVGRQADRLQAAFVAWLKERWTDTPEDEQKVPTTDERSLIVDWPPWHAKWNGARVRFESPDPIFPPAPSAIWLETEQWEKELEAFRKRFAPLVVGTSVKVPDPPPKQTDGSEGFEDPGGVKQPSIFEGASDVLSGVTTIVLIIAGAWVVSSVAGVWRG
jgi:hypothetical protein